MSTLYPNSIPRTLDQKIGEIPSVLDFGAVGDCINVTDASMTAGSPILASASALFTADSVGAIVCVGQAAGGGVGITGTISSFTDTSHVVLSRNSAVTVSGVVAFWGTDDTGAIQNALAACAGHELVFPNAVYLINPYGGSSTPYNSLVVQSGTTLTFQGNATIQAMATIHPSYAILCLNNVSDITINGGILIGERLVHLAVGGGVGNEFGFGIFMQTAKNVAVYDTVIKNCWGDGSLVYGGAATDSTRQPSENIIFHNIHCDNNRRQGISIVSVKGCSIIGGLIENTNGTGPEFGIDVEPDTGADFIEGVYIAGITTRFNCGGGIILTPVNLCQTQNNKCTVTIDGWTSFQDSCGSVVVEPDRPTGFFRGESSPALNLSNGGGSLFAYPLGGQVSISNVHIIEPGIHGVGFSNWSAYMPKTTLTNVTVTNPNRTATGPGTGVDYTVPDGGIADLGWSTFENGLASTCGIVVGANSVVSSVVPVGSSPSYTAHLDFVNCKVEDNRATQALALGYYVHTNDGDFLPDASFTDCSTEGGNGQNINWNSGVGVEIYSKKPLQSLSPGESATAGFDVQPNASCVISLPGANDVVGREFYFTNPGTHSIQLRPLSTDTIGPSGVFGIEPGNDLVMRSPGDHVKLKSVGNNTWIVQAATGDLAPLGFYPFNRQIGGTQLAGIPATLIPTTGPGNGGTVGLWKRGDYIEDNLPNGGFSQGILCVSGGTGSADVGTPHAVWEKVGPIQYLGEWHYNDPSIFTQARIAGLFGGVSSDSKQLVLGAGTGTAPNSASASWGNASGGVFTFGTGVSGVFDQRFNFVDNGELQIFARVGGVLTQIFDLSATGVLTLAGTLAVQNSNARFYSGTGTPLGVVSAYPGSIFLRTDGGAGTSIYIKESDVGGSTGWVPITTSAGNLTGDVTSVGLVTTVALVDGSTAANVHAAELLANAATDSDTVFTIVKRDSSGNFSAGTITANLTGNASGTAASITGNLTGDVTSVGMVTTVAFVDGSTAANVHAAELLANAATNLDTVSTIVKRDSSGNFSAGTINVSNIGCTGDILVANNKSYYGVDTVGTSIRLVEMLSDNTIRIGAQDVPTTNGHLLLYSNGTEKVRIMPGGNVLIGTTADDGSHKLQVNGTVLATTVSANLIGNVTGNTSGTAASITGNLTGDVTSVGMATTLSTTAVTPATYGDGTHVGSFTVDSKGRITAASNIATAIGNLTGDVTSVGLATTAVTVGGSTASNIHAAELLANAATNLNTASTIVRRDSGGNFLAGTITSQDVAGHGTVSLATGNASLTGYIQWRLPSTTRLGYIGADSANVALNLENSANFVVSNGNLRMDNSFAIAFKDTGGSNINCLLLPSDNTFRVGIQAAPASNGHLLLFSNGTEKARIMPGGNVLIGTTSDDGSHLLQVNGTVSATTITANVTGNCSGTAASITGNLTGDVTSSGMATTLATVTVAKGGTGKTSATAHYVQVGNGTSALTDVAPSTSGFVLTSNGASSDPSFQVTGVVNNSLTADATGDLTCTTSPQDVPGATISLTQTGKYLIVGTFYGIVTQNAGAFVGSLVVGGSTQTGQVLAILGTATATDTLYNTASRSWIYTNSGTTTAKLQANKNSASGTATCAHPNTGISAVFLG
jgi:hypothetical protein